MAVYFTLIVIKGTDRYEWKGAETRASSWIKRRSSEARRPVLELKYPGESATPRPLCT